MKLSSGKRIGQSGQELVTAGIFSFALHVLTLAAAVFLITATPKTHIPPFYDVKLVGQPAEIPQTPSPAAAPPAAAKPQTKPVQKEKKTQVKERKTPAKIKKGAIPELAKSKPKPSVPEQKAVEPASKQAAAPAGAAKGEAGSTGAMTQGVAVSTPEDFKFSWYLVNVRQKIGQNWNPPPDARDAKARVVFSINRSGWVGTVNLVDDQSSGAYQFKLAAIRAIRASNPFPPLPEEFSKQSLEFSVDLMAVE